MCYQQRWCPLQEHQQLRIKRPAQNFRSRSLRFSLQHHCGIHPRSIH